MPLRNIPADHVVVSKDQVTYAQNLLSAAANLAVEVQYSDPVLLPDAVIEMADDFMALAEEYGAIRSVSE